MKAQERLKWGARRFITEEQFYELRKTWRRDYLTELEDLELRRETIRSLLSALSNTKHLYVDLSNYLPELFKIDYDESVCC